MKLKYIVTVSVLVISMLVCGCVGAGAIIPALNNVAPGNNEDNATIDPTMASDPVVGTWKLEDPLIKSGKNTLDLTDARWIFGADGSYEYWPWTVGIFKTTGTWTRDGTDRYNVVCGKDSQIIYYNLVDGRLCSEEDQRYVLEKVS